MADKEVVVSPGWSIHAGVGTKNYGFCWGMGGENQAYDDMDPVTIADLKYKNAQWLCDQQAWRHPEGTALACRSVAQDGFSLRATSTQSFSTSSL